MFKILKISLLICASLLALPHCSLGQKPVVQALNKRSAAANEILTISGSGFSATKTDLVVTLGAARGEIITATTASIEVKIPTGATFSSVSVTNIKSGLTGYSSALFDLSFGGETFDPSLMGLQEDFISEPKIHDICVCDLDNDGKVDVIGISNDSNSKTFFIHRNTSTAGTISFETTTKTVNFPLYNLVCGDLDGDGRPELMASRTGTSSSLILVSKNNSTPGNIVFDNVLPFTILGQNASRLLARDLDGDGKPEIIVTNNFNNIISIFQNNSLLGVLDINVTPIPLVASSISTDGLQGLAVEDLNKDGLPDIIVNASQKKTFSVLQNTSIPGQFSFKSPLEYTVATTTATPTLINLVAGDLDNDGFPEIVLSNLFQNNVSLYRNTTTTIGGDISLSAENKIATNSKPWGLTMGDLDGDGKTDIVVASIEGFNLAYLKNESTTGTVSVLKSNIATNKLSKNVKIADIDGDGKPDLIFTSKDATSSYVSVKRNLNCLKPELTPATPATICAGSAYQLKTVSVDGATYKWLRNGVSYKDGTEPFLDITETGTYAVTVTSAGGSCQQTSSSVEVTVTAGVIPEDPVASNSGPFCIGSTIHLTSTTVTGATYTWTGPNGFTSTLQNPQIANAQLGMAGVYSLEIKKGSCQSGTVTTTVQVEGPPSVSIISSNPTTFCRGKSTILSVPNNATHTYQWKKNGANVTGAVTSSFLAQETGSYTVVVTKDGGCSAESAALTVTTVEKPVAKFDIPSVVCVNQNFVLENISESQAGIQTFYAWNFGDGSSTTGKNVSQTYTQPGVYAITLKVYYADEDCNGVITKDITVLAPFEVAIKKSTAEDICEGQPVSLSVVGSFSEILWSTGATTTTIDVTAAGAYSVKVKNSGGCIAQASLTVDFISAPLLLLEADRNIIEPGESVQLSASGAMSYTWSGGESLSNTSISNPIASPLVTTTYIVTGIGENGCKAKAEITIEIDNSINIKPSLFFSPNGDGTNDTWFVEKIENYPACQLVIFDRQGIKVFTARPYANDWDGTLNGKPLMEGVYYFVIKCDGYTKSGSITLLR